MCVFFILTNGVYLTMTLISNVKLLPLRDNATLFQRVVSVITAEPL